MPQIALLSQETIDKIAAGEVIERPSSVVKELVENAMDAGANAVTVEIKEGGTSFIRITDNGCGIDKKQIPLAFLRHSTSKIKAVEDLMTVTSLGFRGEALSSIAAVAQIELITKTPESFTGTRYVIEGSKEIAMEEIGAPDGTTFLIRNLFFNTPARRKFLKSIQTEGGYINDLMQHMILSHPNISFKFILNGQVKLQSAGNSNINDIIYHIYGREISSAILEINEKNEAFSINGFVGKPQISRGNRNFEIYFINGRYIKSNILSKAIEEAYKPFLMQHQYPFTVLYFKINSELLDINVHPTKMELRFSNQEIIYRNLIQVITNTLRQKELIPQVPVPETKKHSYIVQNIDKSQTMPEPFEKNRLEEKRKQEQYQRLDLLKQVIHKDSPYEKKYEEKPAATIKVEEEINYEQESFLTKKSAASHKIIGQLFDTYWMVEFEEKLYIIDQHAAHEKVLYERTMNQLRKKEYTSQTISPPILLTLSMSEEEVLHKYMEVFQKIGYEIESFGGKEYAVCAVPANMFSLDGKVLITQMLDELAVSNMSSTPDLILEKIASMSCKAAVKGNQHLSRTEVETLINELLQLDNPYNCPHGRPTIISMTKYEIEKKFKRII